MYNPNLKYIVFLYLCLISCATPTDKPLQPIVITKAVFGDSDDPAIWVHKQFPDSTIILGTDKDSENGGIYVFDIHGKIDSVRSKFNMKRVNNIDIANHFSYLDKDIAIAVATERDRHSIRIYSIPQMQNIDGGGIEVFKDDTLNLPMGIAL
jgi:3-phytase